MCGLCSICTKVYVRAGSKTDAVKREQIEYQNKYLIKFIMGYEII